MSEGLWRKRKNSLGGEEEETDEEDEGKDVSLWEDRTDGPTDRASDDH